MSKYEKPLLTEDYLIRMINLALAAIARIVGFKTAGQYQAAHEMVNQVLEQLFGLRGYMIKMLDDSVLIKHLTVQGILDTNRLYVVADLMKEEGDLHAAQNSPADSYWSYLRSLNFFLEVVLNGGAPHFAPPHEKINFLLDTLESYTLPADTSYALFAYFEKIGAYAKADRALGDFFKIADHTEAVLHEFVAFYERLLAKSEASLAKGGLSHAQVQEKLKRLPPSV
jgi:hypothetical protein